MQGLSTERAPSPSVVVPHYVFAAVAFFALTVMILLSSGSFIGHYFQPRLLAITHVAALGWGTMIIFGALYQLLPVILESSLFSEKLAKITFVFLAAGTLLLAFAFWNFYTGWWLQVAAALLLTAISLFSVNVLLTAKAAGSKSIEADFISTSVIWLLLTGILGVLMSFNFEHVFLPKSHLLYLKIHAHLGMIGWFLLLIIGVASKLIPMFLLSHKVNRKKLSVAFYLINGSLLFMVTDWLFTGGSRFFIAYPFILLAGVGFFGSFLAEVFKKRLRKKLDAGLRHSFVAFIAISIPVVLGVVFGTSLFEDNAFMLQVYQVYGITILLTFITALILGQTFKTLPFIIWLKKFRHLVGKTKTPLPKELYSEKLANWQLYLYAMAILLLITGVLMSQQMIIFGGGLFLLLAAILYNINVFRILFYAVKPRSNE